MIEIVSIFFPPTGLGPGFEHSAADAKSAKVQFIVALAKSSVDMGRSQNFEQPFDVTFIVIKMGSYSYGVSPDADKNPSLREHAGQSARNAIGMPNANHVATPFVWRKYGVAFTLRICGDPPSECRNCFLDVVHSPSEDLPHGCHCHWVQYKLGELAHVESASSRPVFISVINQSSELFASGPCQPRLLKRHSTFLPFRSDVQIPKSIWPEWPLVTNCD